MRRTGRMRRCRGFDVRTCGSFSVVMSAPDEAHHLPEAAEPCCRCRLRPRGGAVIGILSPGSPGMLLAFVRLAVPPLGKIGDRRGGKGGAGAMSRRARVQWHFEVP